MALSESATVAEIATASPAAARVFQQLGIDYHRDGSRSLAEVCREKGLDSSAITAEIESRGSGILPAPGWTTAPLSTVIAHILATHHEYLKRELPLLSERLARVAQVYGEREQQTMSELPRVFQDLHDELALHMRKEEIMLFPAIEEYEASSTRGALLPSTPFGSIANPIRMMERDHESADAALARMRELTHGYGIPPYACVTYTALMDGLRALESDLRQHIHLENDILFPRAIRLEQEYTAGQPARTGM